MLENVVLNLDVIFYVTQYHQQLLMEEFMHLFCQ